jgi:hypothetical protein
LFETVDDLIAFVERLLLTSDGGTGDVAAKFFELVAMVSFADSGRQYAKRTA